MTDLPTILPKTQKLIGVSADHGGYELKEYLVRTLREAGYGIIDYGVGQPNLDDDYPDFVVPAGVRACLVHETFSAHQGVEDDDMNMICLGGLVVGQALAWELVKVFLQTKFSGAERFQRRLAKVAALEHKETKL